MTKIKLCGMTRQCDIEAANLILPEYIGFVFFRKSKRFVAPEKALSLGNILDKKIKKVGVFVNESPENPAKLANNGIIDIIQLHGAETEEYVRTLRSLTDRPIIKAFSVNGPLDVEKACKSSADLVLLDSGTGGTGTVFDWELLRNIKRDYFLAGGLDEFKVKEALEKLSPYGVDVSSGIETGGFKDTEKMKRFAQAVRTAQSSDGKA